MAIVKKICGYARVSSNPQEESLETQVARLMAYGVEPENIIRDIKSGRKQDRPGYKRLLGMVRGGKVSKLVVTRHDRLSRTQSALVSAWGELERYGVELVAIDQPTENTAMGKLVRGMHGLMSEFEVENLRDRIKKALDHKRVQKEAFKPPFGYITEKCKFAFDKRPIYQFCRLDLKPPLGYCEGTSRYDIARALIALFFEVRSLRQTLKFFAEEFQIVHYQGENKNFLFKDHAGFGIWLKNPVLQGDSVYNVKGADGYKTLPRAQWTVVNDTHTDCYLSRQEGAKILEILSENTRRNKYTSATSKTLFSGLILCQRCGSPCQSQGTSAGNIKYKYYQCRGYANGACGNKKQVRYDRIEEAVWKKLSEIIQTRPEFLEESTEEKFLKEQKLEVHRRIEAIEKKICNLSLLGEEDSVLRDVRLKYEEQIKALQADLKSVDMDLLSYDQFRTEATSLLHDITSNCFADIIRDNKSFETTRDWGEPKYIETEDEQVIDISQPLEVRPWFNINNPEIKFTPEHGKILRKLIQEIYVDNGRVTQVVPLLLLEK